MTPPADKPADDAWLLQYYTPEKPGAAPDAAAPPLTPQPPGKYEDAHRLGAGAEKEVVRVRDRDTRREVALAQPRDGRSRAAFIREARVLARLEHPHIVPLHDLGLAPDGRPYFTMKLLAGETLEGVLARLRAGDAATAAKYPLSGLLDIFVRVCDAIAFAHSRGVVHRDLKPSNIRLGDYGEVRVIDWGLAKTADEADGPDPSDASDKSDKSDCAPSALAADLTAVGTVKGTPGYMAPEQAAGRGEAADVRTDTYALGALLYAILTWQPPVAGETTAEVLRRTVAGEIVPPRRRAPARAVPRALEAIAMKALAAHPSLRYQTADALLADLRAFAGGHAASAEEAGPVRLLWLLVKRHQTLSLVIAASALALATLSLAAVARVRASEQTALTALASLQEEHALRGRLARAAVPELLAEARAQARGLDYDGALATLRTTIGVDPSQADAWDLAGWIYFGQEQFEQAASAFRRELQALVEREPPGRPRAAPARGRKERPARNDPAVTLAERGAGLAGREHRPLPPEAFQRLILDLRAAGSKYARESRIALGVYLVRRNPEAWTNAPHRALVAWALRALNDGRAELDLQPTATGLEARVSGPAASDLLPLARLPLTALDLHGTAVKDLQPLKGMPLRTLDISGTAVANLDVLAGMPLRELDAEGLKKLPADIFQRCPTLETVVVSAATDVPHHTAWPQNATVVRK